MSGIYVHIPFCKQKCTYCDFASFPHEIGKAEVYFGCLYKELKARSLSLKDRTFDTIYFGGGTPSFVEPKYIYGALKQIYNEFNVSKNAEITLEVNPGTIDEIKLKVYKNAGITRFSVGLQTANDSSLYKLNRIHTAKEFENAIKLLDGYNVSVDVMLGLPDEYLEDVKNTLDLATSFDNVKHVSVYALKAEEGTPMFTRYLNGELPSDDEVRDLYDFALEYLENKGYLRYEVSNFSKPGYESKHNLNYWERGEYIGVGVGASSFISNRRFTNTESIDEYVHAILSNKVAEVFSEEVSFEDGKNEFAMLSLRTKKGANLKKYKEIYNEDFTEYFKDAIKKNKKYLDISDDFISIKKDYLYVQNSIIVDFIMEK